MRRQVWIYALVDPRDLKPRYVGQSRSVLQRYDQHYFNTTTKGLGAWMGELGSRRPMLLLLDRVKPELADAAEEWWIREGQKRGWALLNVVRRRKFKGAA